MNTFALFRTIVALLVLVALGSMSALVSAQPASTPAVAATTSMPGMGTSGAGMPGGASGMGPMMGTAEFDLMFIDMMTLHHQGAVAMAEVALERGEHPELVQLAEDIIAAQEAEIAQLQAWREAWYPDTPVMSMEELMGGMGAMMSGMPGMQDMAGMSMMSMVGMMDPAMAGESLRGASEPFDLAFINAMIPHHLGALMMAEMAVQMATHPELITLAERVIAMQETEIATMRAWRGDWYGPAATPAS